MGRAAKEWQVLHPERCVALFKRQMGSQWSVKLVGKKFSPEDLSALILRSLKGDAEAFLGESIERAEMDSPKVVSRMIQQCDRVVRQVAPLPGSGTVRINVRKKTARRSQVD